MVFHSHHIVPKHMGGVDSPENETRVNLPLHAFLHKCLWERYGKLEDKAAWLGLSGRRTEAQEVLKSIQRAACRTPEFRAKMRAVNTGMLKPWVTERNKRTPKPATGTSRSALWRHAQAA